MNLPNAINAYVEEGKVVEYLLAFDHPEGGGKADFFTRFGFAADEWKALADALVAHAQSSPVSSVSESKYGTKYRIDGRIVARTGGLLPFVQSGSSMLAQPRPDWSPPIRCSKLST